MKRFNIGAMYRELEVERDELKLRATELETEKQNITETAIWLVSADCCQEHLQHINRQLFGEFVGEQKELGCHYCNKEQLAAAQAERDEAIQEKHRAWASLDHAIEENRKVERERDQARTGCVVMRQALEETEQALKEVSGVEALAYVHGHRYTDKQIELFNRARDLRDRALSTTADTDLRDELEREMVSAARADIEQFKQQIARRDKCISHLWQIYDLETKPLHSWAICPLDCDDIECRKQASDLGKCQKFRQYVEESTQG